MLVLENTFSTLESTRKRVSLGCDSTIPVIFAWLIRERAFDKRPNLPEALLTNGLFPAALLEEPDSKLRDEQAKRILDSWNEIEEFAVVGPVVSPSAGASADAPDGSKEKAKRKELTPKQRARQVAHLKYMAPHQSEEDYKLKPKRAALLDRAHSTMDVMRMSPVDFTETMVAYGLFANSEAGMPSRNLVNCALQTLESKVANLLLSKRYFTDVVGAEIEVPWSLVTSTFHLVAEAHTGQSSWFANKQIFSFSVVLQMFCVSLRLANAYTKKPVVVEDVHVFVCLQIIVFG